MKFSKKDLFDQAYTRFTPDVLQGESIKKYIKDNNQSLVKFIKSYFQQFGGTEQLRGRHILEVGCGHGGCLHFLAEQTDKLYGIDLSELAITQARQLAKEAQLNINFLDADITKGIEFNQTFKLIVDSHLYHCLTDKEERKEYLSFLHKHLDDDGVVLIETMTYNENIREPLDFELCEDYILWQNIQGQRYPTRRILPSIEIEKEIKQSQLKIKTFFYHDELSFQVFPHIENYPEFRLPKTIRLSLEKDSFFLFDNK
ncbi:MAG: hypothetical protein CME62_05825 [Halobacteriovoraceae bacterium]|nr:hypothetical protein [Halobacteriovoraceae bacterium]|tara:strand:+ start:26926 stop:27696 length:771 start_codon:yes stop_codon:yes gene_type:complete